MSNYGCFVVINQFHVTIQNQISARSVYLKDLLYTIFGKKCLQFCQAVIKFLLTRQPIRRRRQSFVTEFSLVYNLEQFQIKAGYNGERTTVYARIVYLKDLLHTIFWKKCLQFRQAVIKFLLTRQPIRRSWQSFVTEVSLVVSTTIYHHHH